jgi:hypothetical protein
VIEESIHSYNARGFIARDFVEVDPQVVLSNLSGVILGNGFFPSEFWLRFWSIWNVIMLCHLN